jgi:MFS family permease
VYQVDNAAAVVAAHRAAQAPASRWVNRTVLALGLTSLFTDVSAEMITAVMPLYLVFGLHVSPLVFGAVDGLYQAAAAPARLFGGLVADRTRRHKLVAAAGYGLSTLARIGMVLAGAAWGALAGLVLVDRLGKGIRTAPRDAMIADATPRRQWGAAYGVHRALDMAGATAGPVLAFAVLAVAPGGYDAVFVVSLGAGLIGLAVLVVYAPGVLRRRRTDRPKPTPSVSVGSALRLVRRAGVAAILVAATLLGLTTLGDAFVYLVLQDRLDFAVGLFPLLFVATSVVFMVLAVPVGRLADRVGRGRVFIGGYAALLAVYVVLLVPAGAGSVIVAIVLLGAYYAATDGVLVALVGETLPDELRGSGMALTATATSLARLASSLLFGLVWTTAGVRPALVTVTVGLTVALAVAVVLVGRNRRGRREEVVDVDVAG